MKYLKLFEDVDKNLYPDIDDFKIIFSEFLEDYRYLIDYYNFLKVPKSFPEVREYSFGQPEKYMYYNYFNYKETPEDTIFLVKFSNYI